MHFRNSNFKHKMRKSQIPQKHVNGKLYVHTKKLRTRNCRHKFTKNLLPEKRKENMKTKQPQFKSRLKKIILVDFFISSKLIEL